MGWLASRQVISHPSFFLFLLTQRSKSTGQKSHPKALPFPSWSLYPFLFSFSLIVTVFSNSFLNQAHEQDIVSLSHRFSFTVEYSIFEAFQAKGTPFFLQSEWKECSVYIIKQNTDPCIHVHKTLTVSNMILTTFCLPSCQSQEDWKRSHYEHTASYLCALVNYPALRVSVLFSIELRVSQGVSCGASNQN